MRSKAPFRRVPLFLCLFRFHYNLMVCRFLLALLVPFLLQFSWALKHERVPAGLRPAKAVNEQRAEDEHQNEPITFSTTILQNSSRPLIFHKNVKTGRKNDGAFGIAFAINATEGTPTKARVTFPPPAGKDFGVNTILQTNLVDSRGRVLKGVSAVQLPVPDIRNNSKESRASASQVEAEENAIPIKFSG